MSLSEHVPDSVQQLHGRMHDHREADETEHRLRGSAAIRFRRCFGFRLCISVNKKN